MSPLLHIRRLRPVVAFSRRDTRNPRFELAAAAAMAHGFAAHVRPVGGSAAPLHQGSLVLDHYGVDPDGVVSPHHRFTAVAEALRAALASLGLDARVGPVPREYCPGDHSVNARGRVKIAGIAQRIRGRSWLVSSVVQVHGGPALREVTLACYDALGLELDPSTIGTVEEEVGIPDPRTVAAEITTAYVRHGLVRPDDILDTTERPETAARGERDRTRDEVRPTHGVAPRDGRDGHPPAVS
ncbi:lipoyl protein ligase domain-containing protein [Streptosporangium amethystogenes]|uniref:lipoyl protein ligase domain-containing protein n=1 Tax=Streptosporangium amethystogenes TaxID=2002 RepID=UPI0037873F6A